jgi:hypothetical protein
MDYDTLLNHVIALLQREQRLSYRVLKRQLQLDDETLEDLKEESVLRSRPEPTHQGRQAAGRRPDTSALV